MTEEQIAKLREEMLSPEGIKKGIELLNEMQKEKEELEKKKKEIVSNTEYIEWAISFLERRINEAGEEHFSNDPWFDFMPSKYDEEERKKVESLYIFYGGIENYANKNYIYPQILSDREVSYRIKYKDRIFTIAEYSNPEIRHSFSLSKNNDETEFINFEDIMNDIELPRARELNEVKTLINKCFNDGYTYDQIFNSIKSAYLHTVNEDDGSTFTGDLLTIKCLIISLVENGLDFSILEKNLYGILEELRDLERQKNKALRKKIKKETDN